MRIKQGFISIILSLISFGNFSALTEQPFKNSQNNSDGFPSEDCTIPENTDEQPKEPTKDDINYSKKLIPPSYFALLVKEIIPDLEKNITFLMNNRCFMKYFGEKNYSKVNDLVKYSSKSFPDFGDEDGCILKKNTDYTYLLLTFSYYTNESISYTGKFKFLPFISKGFSFFGLCLEDTKECTTDFVQNISQIVNLIKMKGVTLNGIRNLTVKTFIHSKQSSEIGKKLREIENKKNYPTLIFILISSIYIFMRIVIWIIGYRFFKENDEDFSNKNKDEDNSSEEEEEEEEEEEKSNSQTSTKEITDDKKDLIPKKEKVKQESKKKIYPKFYIFYRICSFAKGFKLLFQKSDNILFDETGLYLIIFFRIIAILFKTFYLNFNYYIHNPSREINNTDIFETNIVGFIKFTSFSDVLLILSESIMVSYKLMSFIRKHSDRTEGPSFKLFINFFIRIIPSIFSIIIIFTSMYLYSEILINLFSLIGFDTSATKVQHLINNIIDCKSCVNDYSNFIPFYMNYHNFDDKTNTNDNCFSFMLIVVNLFYCYCFCIIITFLSFKIKNKIFDMAFSILFVIYFFLPNELFCNSLEYFNVNIILGESCSTTYTHLFINYYIYGFLIGFALFYNNDITNENSLQNSNIYKPFYYLKDMIGLIFKSPNWLHLLIIIISFFITILFCHFYYLFLDRDKTFIETFKSVELTTFHHFIYLNEKTILIIFFGFFLTHLYTYKTESNLKNFGNNIIVIFFHRIGYEFYALIEIMIGIMYSNHGLNYSITGYNLSFISIGIIFVITIMSTINNVMYYIPMKYLFNKLLHDNSNKKK